MNKILLSTCFVLAAGFAAGAMAHDAPAQTNAPASAADANQAANTSDKVATEKRAVPAPGDRNCVRDTGSLIPPAKGHCLPVNGRSYSHQDIQRTGQPDLAHALQQLDPSVQVSGN